MAKKRQMRNSVRAETKLWEDRAALVNAALDAGIFSRDGICKFTEMKIDEVVNLFSRNRGIYARYKVLGKMVMDTATENIREVVMDKTHPKNYDASKFMVQNFKSEFDDVLESKDESLELEVPYQGVDNADAKPVLIRFSKKKD